MKKTVIIILTVLIISGCRTNKRDRLESFVCIQNNLAWIQDSSRIHALDAISITNDFKDSRLAFCESLNGPYKFYKLSIPDSLKSLIYKSFHNKVYPEYYRIKSKDQFSNYYGNYFNIIYKFQNQPERIISYIPPALPDSLRQLTEILETLASPGANQTSDSFPIHYITNKYRNQIIKYQWPIIHPPPVIIDSI